MFNRKTLFIVGAGAGYNIGLPVGRDLAKDIANRTKIVIDHYARLGKGTVDDHLALSFFERGSGKDAEYAQAFNLIRHGILLANSIDDFLNVHEGSPAVVEVGKAAIVRSILYAERHSKLFVDPSNIYNKLNLEKVHDSWFVKFMQVLAPGRKVPDVERVLDDVSFIVFNYDRCLEHFLVHALLLLYGIPKEKAAAIVERATIIHPYGSVGRLDRVPFGGNDEIRPDYSGLSKAIKTYTEQIEEQSTLDDIHQAIDHAECLVFLGFAYHKQNMDLLFKSHARLEKTKYVFGTAFGMSDADKEQVANDLVELFPQIDEDEGEEDDGGSFGMQPLPKINLTFRDHVHIENKLGCPELFDYYAKSLAG
jgi:hypothetical protein